ncbi:class I SAM-dependent methyltransferase [Roseateles violae]|uniref:Class I SAM-dependent methyltransferase n=1 Tax=Roseateles violae TaxID=3058042 RepID=A0ABT8DTD0_9BURK|nr:class I SAM-dependent methyltransferase [Pelomonas sp. PFR6]MDN3920308.1 class I SAM-dependent methyltransferase [Pelomonas sp. PFR6]
MDQHLQRRIQRYGWDRAAEAYAHHWHRPLAGLQRELLALAAPAASEAVLDVACGPGAMAAAAARAVGSAGRVLGIDLSEAMVQAASRHAAELGLDQASFARMDAERLALPDASFDLALCSLGLMYLPDPEAGLRELCRVLRPGGRAVLAVWGERALRLGAAVRHRRRRGAQRGLPAVLRSRPGRCAGAPLRRGGP